MAKVAKMNKKAEIFNKFLTDNKITGFNNEVMDNDLKTVYFRSSIEIEEQKLLFAITIDDSIKSMFTILIAEKVVNEKNRVAVLEEVNKINAGENLINVFFDEEGSIFAKLYLLSEEDNFEPKFIVNWILDFHNNFGEYYNGIMKTVWASK